MPLVRMQLKELQDGEVKYISLVDRAATRMPIRVIKRGEHMLDLTSIRRMVTKKETVAATPQVSGVIVYAQKSDKATEAIKKVIQDHGFKVDNILVDKDAIMYAQDDKPMEDGAKKSELVRLSDDVVLVVKGFQPANPNIDGQNFQAAAASKNFHQGVDSSLDVLFEKICNTLNVAKSEQEAATQVGGLLDSFKKYIVAQVESLPTTAFKMDYAVRAVADEAALEEAKKGDILSLANIEALFSKQSPDSMGENEWGAMSTGDKLTWILGSWVKKGEGAKPAAKPAAVKLEKPTDTAQDKWDGMNDDEKTKHVASCKATKGDAAPKKAGVKASEVMKAITALTAKVDGLVTKQTEADKTLGGLKTANEDLAKKNDALTKRITGTIAAGAGPDDSPAKGPVKVEKVDPRSGNFDTAFLARNDRATKRATQ